MGLRQIDRRFEKGTGLRCSPVPFQVLIRMRRVETRWGGSVLLLLLHQLLGFLHQFLGFAQNLLLPDLCRGQDTLRLLLPEHQIVGQCQLRQHAPDAP